jgi:hypothetical protein
LQPPPGGLISVQRAAEVHHSSSSRSVELHCGGVDTGLMTAFSDYGDLPGVAPPTVRLDIYSYMMDDVTERRATEVCRD